MRVKETLAWGAKQLKNSPSSRLDAEVLLAFAIDADKTSLYRNPTRPISPTKVKKYQKLIGQRALSVPVAYLTNTKEFYGLPFYVNRTVLIPRPETEALVKLAIKIAGKKNIKKVHDVGTGSGNIAVALAKNLPRIKVVASDICRRALKVAERNVKSHRVNRQIELVHSPLANHIKTAKLIVANLPYVPSRYDAPKDVLHEPKKAIFAGEDGLKLYRQLFTDKFFKTFAGTCLIELGNRQAKPMKQWLAQHLPNTKITPILGISRETCGLRIDFS